MLLLSSIYFWSSYCLRILADQAFARSVEEAVLRDEEGSTRYCLFRVDSSYYLNAESKRYENWPLLFFLLLRIRVLLCAFEFSAGSGQ